MGRTAGVTIAGAVRGTVGTVHPVARVVPDKLELQE